MTTMSTAVKPIFHTAQRNFESSQYALPSDEGEQERLVQLAALTFASKHSGLILSATVQTGYPAPAYRQGLRWQTFHGPAVFEKRGSCSGEWSRNG